MKKYSQGCGFGVWLHQAFIAALEPPETAGEKTKIDAKRRVKIVLVAIVLGVCFEGVFVYMCGVLVLF